jgi:hypothetical protein
VYHPPIVIPKTPTAFPLPAHHVYGYWVLHPTLTAKRWCHSGNANDQAAIKRIQRRIGYVNTAGVADGKYDRRMENFVLAYQKKVVLKRPDLVKSVGLRAHGVIDSVWWKTLQL